jgi:hypothetical protein
MHQRYTCQLTHQVRDSVGLTSGWVVAPFYALGLSPRFQRRFLVGLAEKRLPLCLHLRCTRFALQCGGRRHLPEGQRGAAAGADRAQHHRAVAVGRHQVWQQYRAGYSTAACCLLLLTAACCPLLLTAAC